MIINKISFERVLEAVGRLCCLCRPFLNYPISLYELLSEQHIKIYISNKLLFIEGVYSIDLYPLL